MADGVAYILLFDNGITTTDNVTLNAGRGVGMSIVKESIESRGGSIHIESTQQLGTTFTLMLPVQLASRFDHVNDGCRRTWFGDDDLIDKVLSGDPLPLRQLPNQEGSGFMVAHPVRRSKKALEATS